MKLDLETKSHSLQQETAMVKEVKFLELSKPFVLEFNDRSVLIDQNKERQNAKNKEIDAVNKQIKAKNEEIDV
jgi:hypothetical protein